MNKYQRINIRVATAVSVGVLVAAIALAVAWRNLGRLPNFWPEQQATRLTLQDLDSLIGVYQQETKALPASLADLRRVQGAEVHGVSITFEAAEDGSPLDGWGRPFTYSVDGTNYTIVSLGRDGKPGGVGLDYDLSNVPQPPKDACPTFGQFLFNPWARNVLFTCFAGGVMAFWLSMKTINPAALHGWAIPSLIVKLVLTILGTLAVAIVMAVLHVPTGH